MNLPDSEIVNPPEPTPINPSYPVTDFGHYAISGETPAQLLPNLACLDYGSGKGGQLLTYSWDGESALDDSKFSSKRWIDSSSESVSGQNTEQVLESFAGVYEYEYAVICKQHHGQP